MASVWGFVWEGWEMLQNQAMIMVAPLGGHTKHQETGCFKEVNFKLCTSDLNRGKNPTLWTQRSLLHALGVSSGASSCPLPGAGCGSQLSSPITSSHQQKRGLKPEGVSSEKLTVSLFFFLRQLIGYTKLHSFSLWHYFSPLLEFYHVKLNLLLNIWILAIVQNIRWKLF